ncbi:MAG: DUF262 domain-containing protein [Candidatus Saccharicenans sp.]|jgi:hypothetical protein|nr:DUF262 domain-containing protein [Candidatus Saccharicenans sp.]MDH7574620.1 DUF262 domain-containing protein [Candidatus Saccharicenans sp.]
MSPSIKIDVNREYLNILIDELNTGKYLLPSFQRQYVWYEDEIRDLIDSINSNYPIGTIILWKPSSAILSEIDPFSMPLIGSKVDNHNEIYYVIDGQQRLTSLLLLLNNWEILRGGERIKRDPISYNPSNKKFYKSLTRGIDLSKLIRAFYQYDATAISELKKETENEAFIEMEDMIKRMLNKYPIPIYVMETEKEDEKTFQDMAEAFIRVNKYGIRIGNLELMLSFLAGSVGGELKKRIRELYEKFYEIFEIDLQPIIRFTFSNFGLKQTQISKVEQFKRNVKKISEFDSMKAEAIFKQCQTALEVTINLIKDELGINSSSLLPSQTPLVTIAKYFYTKKINSLDDIDKYDREQIIDWFILASFIGYYSSQTDTKLEKDLEIIDQVDSNFKSLHYNLLGKAGRNKITLDDIRRGQTLNVLRLQGRAHLFLLYIILVKNKADDWSGILLGKRKLEDIARHHIFPKEFLEEKLELEEPESKEYLINNLGNITFIDKEINSEIGDSSPEEYIPMYLNAAKKHFVSSDERLWSINQYNTFIEYRIKEIYSAGRKYFPNIFD